MRGISLIASERALQRKLYSDAHDDSHDDAELVSAAKCYLLAYLEPHVFGVNGYTTPGPWPFERDAWRPRDDVRNLQRAGAFIAAEIDRLARANRPRVVETSSVYAVYRGNKLVASFSIGEFGKSVAYRLATDATKSLRW